MLRTAAAYIAAVLTTFIVASVLSTQLILARIASMGPEAPLGLRLQATFHDLIGLSATYLPLLAICLVIALPVAAAIIRFAPGLRLIGYVLAGAVGVLVMHLIAKAALDVSAIAATRTVLGLLAQGAAGAVGGYVFYAMTRRA